MLGRDYQYGDFAEVTALDTRQVIARIRLWPRRLEMDARAGFSIAVVPGDGQPLPEHLQESTLSDKIPRK